MDADNLYDEFGNYIGPELDDGDDGQDVGYAAQVRPASRRRRSDAARTCRHERRVALT
jgi:hypothetical protein